MRDLSFVTESEALALLYAKSSDEFYRRLKVLDVGTRLQHAGTDRVRTTMHFSYGGEETVTQLVILRSAFKTSFTTASIFPAYLVTGEAYSIPPGLKVRIGWCSTGLPGTINWVTDTVTVAEPVVSMYDLEPAQSSSAVAAYVYWVLQLDTRDVEGEGTGTFTLDASFLISSSMDFD